MLGALGLACQQGEDSAGSPSTQDGVAFTRRECQYLGLVRNLYVDDSSPAYDEISRMVGEDRYSQTEAEALLIDIRVAFRHADDLLPPSPSLAKVYESLLTAIASQVEAAELKMEVEADDPFYDSEKGAEALYAGEKEIEAADGLAAELESFLASRSGSC